MKKLSRIRPSRETIGERSFRHGHMRGRVPSPTYHSWCPMITRCTNSNHSSFDKYGGSGVSVSARWRKFEMFLEDMGERPSLDYSIDRFPNRDGNYENGNCRWATRSQQNLNRKTTRPVIRGDGVKFPSMKEAAEVVGGSRNCIRDCCIGRQKTHLGQTYRYLVDAKT
jgi:hypothetical protein